jgi:hypothetical protein
MVFVDLGLRLPAAHHASMRFVFFASYGHENAIELTESIFRLPRTLAHAMLLLSASPV